MDWINQEFAADHVWFIAGRSRNFHFCIGSGNSDSKTAQTNESVGAGSIGVGAEGQYLESGATSQGANSTINLTDGGAIDAIKQIATGVITSGSQATDELFQQLQNVLDQNASVVSANNGLTSAALANNQTLANNAATGGQSETNTVILKVLALAAVALLALGWLFTRSKK